MSIIYLILTNDQGFYSRLIYEATLKFVINIYESIEKKNEAIEVKNKKCCNSTGNIVTMTMVQIFQRKQ